MFNEKDLVFIEGRGSSVNEVEKQVERFKKGFPWMNIVAPATVERGILRLTPEQEEESLAYQESAKTDGRCKFVPASGAASRMFKDIFSDLSKLESGETLPENASGKRLAANIEKFAFYTEELFGKPTDNSEYVKSVLEKVLTDAGLGYGSKPKGVIRFHSYKDEKRTAFAEHLVEAQAYMKSSDGVCHLCVTISPEHRPLFEAALAEVQSKYEEKYGVKYDITFTVQDKGTDTVAVDSQNLPFRTEDGSLLFRPGGHGALIHNLNNVPEEVVSIKNIDNVSSSSCFEATVKSKKVLIGQALQLRDEIFSYLESLDDLCEGVDFVNCDDNLFEIIGLCDEIEEFLDERLCVTIPAVEDLSERVEILRSKLNRPIRVCGMVKNEGEPGGGPFIIKGRDGSTSLQILESVQINPEEASEVLSKASHFNPVDLVCCLHDYKGNKFNLLEYVDEEAGFISSKSYKGRELKALELPGLWNGAMSDWNTIFVEVPLETFNPVKVVLDLLRSPHQS